MLRIVLDTNVFISGILSPQGIPALILKYWKDQAFDIIISKEILGEIDAVLKYPKIRKRHGWSDKEIEAFVRTIPLFAIFTPGRLRIRTQLNDPEDKKFLTAALEGKADYLVTGDKELLRLKN